MCVVFNIPEYSDSESDSSSLERKRSTDGYSKINRKPQTHKRHRKKRTAIPVQPPKIPLGPFGGGGGIGSTGAGDGGGPPMMVSMPGGGPLGSALGMPMMYQKLKNEKNIGMDRQEDESSIDVSSPRDNNSPIVSLLDILFLN